MIALAAAISVFVFDLAGNPIRLAPNQETHIQHNKIMVLPVPDGPVSVIDSQGYNVAIGQEGDIVLLKAKARNGYPIGPMTVRVGGQEFTLRVKKSW
jgi:hypothetical protein